MNALSPLARAPRMLEERLAQLEERLRGGDEGAWSEYRETAQTLALVLAQMNPGAGGKLVTTAELGAAMACHRRRFSARRRVASFRARCSSAGGGAGRSDGTSARRSGGEAGACAETAAFGGSLVTRPPQCLACGQPTRQQIAAPAQLAKGALELVLDRLAWPHEPTISHALDRLVVLAEAGE